MADHRRQDSKPPYELTPRELLIEFTITPKQDKNEKI
jgi:hypothetical protein